MQVNLTRSAELEQARSAFRAFLMSDQATQHHAVTLARATFHDAHYQHQCQRQPLPADVVRTIEERLASGHLSGRDALTVLRDILPEPPTAKRLAAVGREVEDRILANW